MATMAEVGYVGCTTTRRQRRCPGPGGPVWPRGMTKRGSTRRVVQDVAPSTELRKWYSHDLASLRSSTPLRCRLKQAAAQALQHLRDLAADRRLTLLTGSKMSTSVKPQCSPHLESVTPKRLNAARGPASDHILVGWWR